jgi:hypothetical protein
MYYYKFVKVVYKKVTYKNTVFISDNLSINIKSYLFTEVQK